MSKVHPTFTQQQGGRSLFTILTTVFVIFLALCFASTQELVFVVVSVFLGFLACSCLYTIGTNEVWKMTIERGFLSWSYPRWPRSSGCIDLDGVRSMLIDDGSGKVLIISDDDQSQTVRLIGYGFKLRDFIRSYFPHIIITHIESP